MKRSLTIIALGLVLSGYADATMYKWVDTQGKVHYGDTIPAEYANQGNAQLNNNGQVMKKVDAALTPAQIQARDEAAAKAKKEKAEAMEQQRRDKALLATYTEVDEIDLAMKRNLGQADVLAKSNELRIKSVKVRLDGLMKQRSGYVEKQKPVPPDLMHDIKNAGDEIAHLRDNLTALEKEKAATRARYASDRARFRELKGLPPEPVAMPVPAAAVSKK
jgi:hypothetical protein